MLEVTKMNIDKIVRILKKRYEEEQKQFKTLQEERDQVKRHIEEEIQRIRELLAQLQEINLLKSPQFKKRASGN